LYLPSKKLPGCCRRYFHGASRCAGTALTRRVRSSAAVAGVDAAPARAYPSVGAALARLIPGAGAAMARAQHRPGPSQARCSVVDATSWCRVVALVALILLGSLHMETSGDGALDRRRRTLAHMQGRWRNHAFGQRTSRKELKACGTHKLSLAVSVTARQ
jgi:hypothetical protein